MKFETHAPLTVLYRGDLRDTAILVGLVQARASIGIIAYTGDLENKKMDYIKTINAWLKSKGQPLILIHPHLSLEQLDRVLVDPLSKWGWNENECRAALRLHGLSLPF